MQYAKDEKIGANLREARIGRGFTQETLADAIGISFQHLQRYEKGVARIPAGVLVDLSQALEIPIAAFFEGVSENGAEAGPPASDSNRLSKRTIDFAFKLQRLPEPEQQALITMIQSLSSGSKKAV